ncbi:MAG: hypothetical protein WAN35_07375 [Terracidiphilus sp.]
MRLNLRVAGLTTILCLAIPVGFVQAAPASKSGQGTIVIVFKDGHRQSYNLSDIERVEFTAVPAASAAVPGSSTAPSRAHFLGKWEVGDGSGNKFFITLYEDGTAQKSIGDAHGRWEYVNGEARVSWEDGWHDAIRKVGSSYQKSAYGAGKSFTDSADNVTSARNTTPHPI